MPIQATYRPSDIEKRLKILKSQLYGKEFKVTTRAQNSSVDDSFYLKTDLKKITLLALLAVAAELVIYFSQLPGKIKLF